LKKIIVLHFLSVVFKLLIIFVLSFNVFIKFRHIEEKMPLPFVIVEKSVNDPRFQEIKDTLLKLGCANKSVDKITTAILEGADKIKIDPKLIAALIRTESDFDKKAVSEKGYKGLMQTPIATKQWEDVDILIGCKILEEKIGYAKGDIRLALALYKGGNNPLAKKQAEHVIQLYRSL